MANEFIARNGLIALDNSTITGSLTVTGGITGSLLGTASFASTASFVDVSGLNVFAQGGNSFGAQALLGTNDNNNLALETSGSIRMFVSSSGNIGIGTTTPSENLHVSGNILIGNYVASNSQLRFANVTNVGNSAYIGQTAAGFEINPGSVGIFRLQIPTGTDTAFLSLWGNGVSAAQFFRNQRIRFGGNLTTNPSSTLEIIGEGATSSTTSLLIRNSTPTNIFTVRDNGLTIISGSFEQSGSFYSRGISGTDSGFLVKAPNNFDAIRVYDNGTVRLGSDGATTFGLEVYGNQGLAFRAGNGFLSIPKRIVPISLHDGVAINFGLVNQVFAGVNNNYTFFSGDAFGTSAQTWNGVSIIPTVNSQNNAIVNQFVISPTYDIASNNTSATLRGFYYNPTLTNLRTGTTHRAIETTAGNILFQSGSTPLFFVSGSGNIGIGTSTPIYSLDIRSGDLFVTSSRTAYFSNIRPADNTGLITFNNFSGTNSGRMSMDGSTWRFKSQNQTDVLNIFANGNLGIRQTTDAGFNLDVNGTSRFSNNVTVTGSLTVTAGITGSLFGTASFANNVGSISTNITNNVDNRILTATGWLNQWRIKFNIRWFYLNSIW